MKIAVLLTATDNMSNVVNGAVKKSMEAFSAFEIGKLGAKWGIDILKPAIDASGDLEEAGNKLKAVMMGQDGLYSQDTYNKIEHFSQVLSSQYAQSTKDYMDMFRVFKANRIDEKDILGGLGDTSAKLSDYFDQMNPGVIALFASRMKNDFGVTNNQMPEMMDLLARLKDSGVGAGNASEAVTMMTELFSKASVGMANLKSMGFEATKELGVVGGYFLSRGLSPEMLGTNFRRMFDTIRSTEKMNELAAAAKHLGISFNFFDKEHKFLGMKNFVSELGKMKGLTPQQIDAITSKPFGGKMGFSSEMVNFLAQYGTDKFKEFENDVNRQANLDQKVKKIMDGYNYSVSVTHTSWESLKQTFGEGFLPILTKFEQKLNECLVSLRDFLGEHPAVSKFIGVFVGFSSAALFVYGMVKAVTLLRFAFMALGATINLTPIGWIITAISLASLAISNWDTKINIFGHDFGTVGDMMVDMLYSVWWFLKPIVNLVQVLGDGLYNIKDSMNWISAIATHTPYVPDASAALPKNRPFETAIKGVDAAFDSAYNKRLVRMVNDTSSNNITYNHNITINGGKDANDMAEKIGIESKTQFDRMIKDFEERQKRLNFR